MTYYNSIQSTSRGIAACSLLRGFALLPLVVLTSHCKSDDDSVVLRTNTAGAGGETIGSAGSIHSVEQGGRVGASSGGAAGSTVEQGGTAGASSRGAAGSTVEQGGTAGASSGGAAGSIMTQGGGAGAGDGQQAAAGSSTPGQLGGGGEGGRYCRITDPMRRSMLFRCPTDYCVALATAISQSDNKLTISGGATVRAGRCATPAASFDSVYFGTGVGATSCFYRAGVLVGQMDWGDSGVSIQGCSGIFGPVVYGEVPESSIRTIPAACDGLISYRPLGDASAGGAAGAAGAASTLAIAGGLSGGAAGAAGASGNPTGGLCYQAANATCGPCG